MSEKAKRETWHDWLPSESPQPARLFTRGELVDQLRKRGVRASAGDLRYWESVGVLPHSVRQRHEGATRAVYPDWFVPLVMRLRRLQDRDKRSLNEIGPALALYARMLLADGLSLEDVPFSVRPAREHNPVKELSHALADFVAWVERGAALTAPIHEAVLIFRDKHGQAVFASVDGQQVIFSIEVGGEVSISRVSAS